MRAADGGVDPNRIALFVLRGLFFLLAAGTGLYVARVVGDAGKELAYLGVGCALGAVVIASEIFFSRAPIALVSAMVFGTMLGVLVAWLFTGVVEVIARHVHPLGPTELHVIQLVLTVVFVYFGITLILQTKDDFKFIIPYVEFSRELRGTRPFVLDTSALVDGRFEGLVASGLLDAPLVAPRFVIDELHALADSQDKGKRARGRRGLDVLRALRERAAGRLEIVDRDPDPAAAVDRKLVLLAKEVGGKLVTTDAALVKLAGLEGVRAINVHDIARALQARAAPGERLSVRLVKPGEGPEQAVGYLDDGSMVVVERARERVWEEVTVEVTSGIRTSAGHMFFAKLV